MWNDFFCLMSSTTAWKWTSACAKCLRGGPGKGIVFGENKIHGKNCRITWAPTTLVLPAIWWNFIQTLEIWIHFFDDQLLLCWCWFLLFQLALIFVDFAVNIIIVADITINLIVKSFRGKDDGVLAFVVFWNTFPASLFANGTPSANRFGYTWRGWSIGRLDCNRHHVMWTEQPQ